ncbi:MAG: L,D-transpeptidase family protein [Aquificae bacterium]|nr:L,D-transpeptidase family protein [Aquificota bacterium]
MNSVILAVLLVFFTAYTYEIDDLLEEALSEAEKETSEKYYNLALKLFNDGVYRLAVENGETFLKKNNADIKKVEDIFLLLIVSYYQMKQPDKIYSLYMKYLNSPISEDTKKKAFIYTNNLLVRKKLWKKVKALRSKSAHLLEEIKPFPPLEGKYAPFEPGINIFRLREDNLIGFNSIFVSKENQTLIEIAKKLDMGYDEMKIANPHLDPFDITEGEAVFIPRKRMLPVQDFEFYTIYINLSEKRLYYPVIYDGDPYVITFPVGIGKDNTKSPIGEFKITQKKRNPEWVVPKSIREEDPSLPPVVPPGPDNPLGVRAMRLGHTEYLLHGTSKKFGIGMEVSHGCIRMYNRDVERLFEIVPKGTKVVITEKRYKIMKNHKVLIEIFELNEKDKKELLTILEEKGVKTTPHLIEFYNREKRGYATPLN